MRWLVLMSILVTAPALAQPRIGSVRESPFEAGTSRIFDQQGNFVGTARENTFRSGEIDLYDRAGRPTGIEIRQNPFDPARSDVFDTRQPRDH